MKPSDIRPQELLEENLRLYREDLQEFLKRRDAFVIVGCPACRCPSWSREFTKDGFQHCRCNDCGTLYISPRPTEAMLLDFYRNAKSIRHWGEKLFPLTEKQRMKSIARPRARAVARAIREVDPPRGTLVDVGAGFGSFLSAMKRLELFDRLVAIEPSPLFARGCIDRGLDVIELPVEDVKLEGVGVMTAFELIEHLYYPRDFVQVAHDSLAPGGLLVLTTPNIDGFDLLVLGEKSDDIGGPGHLNYFNISSIHSLLMSEGFEVLECTTPGQFDAENVRAKVKAGELCGVTYQPFLEQVFVKHWNTAGGPFQAFLREALMSSHMQVVARRVP